MELETTVITSDNVGTYIHQQHVMRYLFASDFVRGKSVLDVGCGIGYGAAWLAQSAREVVGVDHSAQAIEFAKRHWPQGNLEFVCADAVSLPFEGRQFDVILSFEMIEHLENPDSFLDHVKRLLKPEGVFLCSTPRRLLLNQSGYHFHEYSPLEFKKLLGNYFSGVHIQGQYTPLNFLLKEIRSQARCVFFHFGKKFLHSFPGGDRLAEQIKQFLSRNTSLIGKPQAEGFEPYSIVADDAFRFQAFQIEPIHLRLGSALKIIVAICRESRECFGKKEREVLSSMALSRLVERVRSGMRLRLKTLYSSFLFHWITRKKSRTFIVNSKRTLIFSPHQDDETLGCGGLIALKRKQGVLVSVVFLTDGRQSRNTDIGFITPEELVQIRKQESINALRILGVSPSEIHFLGEPDGQLRSLSMEHRRRLVEQLVQLLRSFDPEEVYVPCREDGHADHEATWELVQEALVSSGFTVEVLQYPIWLFWQVPLFFKFNEQKMGRPYRLAIHSVKNQKREAIAAYRSQCQPFFQKDTGVLPRSFLKRFFFPYELFLKTDSRAVSAQAFTRKGKDEVALCSKNSLV